MTRQPGSLNLRAEDQNLVQSWRDAQAALMADGDGAAENINLLRRANGLPERRHHGPYERREDMVDFHESQRKDRIENWQLDGEGAMVLVAYLVIAGVAFLAGVGFTLLAQWMTR